MGSVHVAELRSTVLEACHINFVVSVQLVQNCMITPFTCEWHCVWSLYSARSYITTRNTFEKTQNLEKRTAIYSHHDILP